MTGEAQDLYGSGTLVPELCADEQVDMPLYSVQRTSGDRWVARKAKWLQLGLRPEVRGRDGNLLFGNQAQLLGYDVACNVCGQPPPVAAATAASADQMQLVAVEPVATKYPSADTPCLRSGCTGTYVPAEKRAKADVYKGGTSVFDPVLCELVYRWYTAPGHVVLDPFAGGAVRGLVAAKLGRQYQGIDLRQVQVADNTAQAQEHGAWAAIHASWYQGDSTLATSYPASPADLVFSCPPYYDLEQYSDDPADLSNQDTYEEFRVLHAAAIGHACKQLLDNRFAVWVVGDVRDSKDPAGRQTGLVQHTIAAFWSAGLAHYDTVVLVNSLGTLPMRYPAQAKNRKAGRHHQYVLVFCKGDPKAAAEACGPPPLLDRG